MIPVWSGYVHGAKFDLRYLSVCLLLYMLDIVFIHVCIKL